MLSRPRGDVAGSWLQGVEAEGGGDQCPVDESVGCLCTVGQGSSLGTASGAASRSGHHSHPGGGAVAWAGVQMKLPRWWGVCTPMWHVSVGPPSGFLCPLLCHLLVPLPAHWGTLAKVMEGVPQEVRRKGGLRVEM